MGRRELPYALPDTWIDSGGHRDDALGMDMIDAYLEHLRQAGSAPAETIKSRRGILERLDRDMPYGVGQVSVDELSAWLYRDKWSQNTRATYWRCIHGFYSWAADPRDPWITGDPTADMTPVDSAKAVPRAATDEQAQAILTGAAQPYRLWALIAAYQGLRCCEISRLDREHVTERQLFVAGKGGRPRVHDTDPGVWAAVKDLPKGPIARHPGTGQRATAHYVSVYSALHFRRHLHIPVSMHKLRHWLGTTVQRQYRDVRVTQRMLGHESLTSTMIYTSASDEQQREARATLPRFAG